MLAVVVPLVLVFVVDGRRGLAQTWLPALVAGVTFGVAQFVASNFISVPLTDIVAALVSAAAVVLMLRVWSPVEGVTEVSGSARRGSPGRGGRHPGWRPGWGPRPAGRPGASASGGGRRASVDSRVAGHDRPARWPRRTRRTW